MPTKSEKGPLTQLEILVSAGVDSAFNVTAALAFFVVVSLFFGPNTGIGAGCGAIGALTGSDLVRTRREWRGRKGS